MKKVLVVVAHADDEVIGCGGTLALHALRGDEVHLLVLADGETSRPQAQAQAREEGLRQAVKVLGIRSHVQLGFPDNKMDTVALLDVVKKVEEVVAKVRPDVVYTHHHADLNVDHQVTHRAVMTACRPQGPGYSTVTEIYSFYVSSSTEWAINSNLPGFRPERVVEITGVMDRLRAALACYEKEMRPYPHPRSVRAIENRAMFWGNTVGAEFGEAFKVERLIQREQA
jgi:LmbE family N-acetylglucosaminyl deacetylase